MSELNVTTDLQLASPCCDMPTFERPHHSLDYDPDDATSIVTTYKLTLCSRCFARVDRRTIEERRGMEERLPIGETIILPTFLQAVKARMRAEGGA